MKKLITHDNRNAIAFKSLYQHNKSSYNKYNTLIITSLHYFLYQTNRQG
jgi:hypothetical protein